ncbi:cupin domain-containing protein [Nocardioides currus]|uniref:Cupin n=1 Tax=Nocardioides currus TaxID=2133958 RepID=A0A2R7YY25_9ACTN|nr:cupin domain-containing protein [Nocardioides currus]PUA81241.1 cupin [Nocardioides currus]
MSFPSSSSPRSYPPEVYDGEGEASAWIRPSDTPPDLTYASGGTCEYLVTGERSRGNLGVYRWTFGEGETGPDPHFHRTMSEHFYVLRGTVRLYDGRAWVSAGVGDYLYVPEGGIHGFKGSDHAQMLLSFTPGGPREDYFEALASGRSMTEEERAEFMLRHDNHWV